MPYLVNECEGIRPWCHPAVYPRDDTASHPDRNKDRFSDCLKSAILPPMITQNPLILVDGSSYLYRAFHALPPLMNSQKFPTGAIYGMVSMLKRLIADYAPLSMAVVFDPQGKTFRDELYPDYKATRRETPPDLIQQIEPVQQIIRAMGIPLIVVEGMEADDVIGTLAREATQHNFHTLIATSDKDFAQLVDAHVTLVNTMTNTTLDVSGVKEKFGVAPAQMIDYLALVGDTSDNVPGVPKVGPKTAAKWLETYHSLDELIANADHITGKIGENLRATLPMMPLIRTLVTIKQDVPLPLHVMDLTIQPVNEPALIEWYKKLEFKNWLTAQLANTQKHNTAHDHYVTIDTVEQLQEWIVKLSAAEVIAFDTETTSLDYMRAKLVGVSFALSAGEAAYVPFGHRYPDAPQHLKEATVLFALKPILENPKIKKIGQNIKYDTEVLANAGIALQGIAFDTMLESYVLDSAGNGHDLDSMALKYLSWRTITFEEVAGKGAKQITFEQVDIPRAARYAAEDADVTLRLHETLWPRLSAVDALKKVFLNIEMPLVPVLVAMERRGVLLDADCLQKQDALLRKRLQILEDTIFTQTQQTFNINSPKQLQDILFQKLQLPILQKTPTGQPSTADAVLQELAFDFEIPRLIIEYRSLSKLISTYTSRLVEQINPRTERIHTSYHQTGTVTGRLSSSEPNLQNIPARSEEGRRIRQAFVAPKGTVLLSADYSQIELRLMAHIAEDPTLIQAFHDNSDIHKATAAEVRGVKLEDVTPEMRRHAKVINFGILYGMSAFGLARQLNVSRHEAQNYIDRYFARYPKVHDYMESTREKAKKQGYVETLWGRRLYLPEANSSQMPRQQAALRAAINAPLQGSAADIIKMAMIRIHQWLQESNEARMIMQVHDELVFEVMESAISIVTAQVREHMTQCVSLKVPLLVSIGTGQNWDEASSH